MLNSFQHLQKIPEPNSGQALKQVQDDELKQLLIDSLYAFHNYSFIQQPQ